MQEAARIAMLSAMGQQVLVPRFILSNAKTSQPLALAAPLPEMTVSALTAAKNHHAVAVEAEIDNSEIIETVITQKPEGIRAKVSLLAGLDAADSSKIRVMTASTVISKVMVTKQYRHRVINFSNIIFMLDQPMLEWVEEKVTFNFLHDIYFALRGQKTQMIEQKTFDWPLGRLKLADDQAAAVEQTFLKEQACSSESEWLICWGIKVAEQFVTSEQPITVGSSHLLDGFKVLVLDELKAYWMAPKKKRLLWQDLQVIRKSFQS